MKLRQSTEGIVFVGDCRFTTKIALSLSVDEQYLTCPLYCGKDCESEQVGFEVA